MAYRNHKDFLSSSEFKAEMCKSILENVKEFKAKIKAKIFQKIGRFLFFCEKLFDKNSIFSINIYVLYLLINFNYMSLSR